MEAHAPRAWCKRLLLWLVFEGQLTLLATGGTITYRASAFKILRESGWDECEEGYALDPNDVDALGIRNALEAKADGRLWESVERYNQSWGEESGALPFGLVPFAEVDWELGTLAATLDTKLPDYWVTEEFECGEDDEVHVALTGLSFDLSQIEMLALPVANSEGRTAPTRPIGRPPKWDWHGALAHVAALASRDPDGLPTGPGAQARIEIEMAQYFSDTCDGEQPAESEIRRHAARVMEALERASRRKA